MILPQYELVMDGAPAPNALGRQCSKACKMFINININININIKINIDININININIFLNQSITDGCYYNFLQNQQ